MKLATQVFLQIPFEYGAMGGIIGKNYLATKDFLKWNNFIVKEWISIFLQAGIIWASEVNDGTK